MCAWKRREFRRQMSLPATVVPPGVLIHHCTVFSVRCYVWRAKTLMPVCPLCPSVVDFDAAFWHEQMAHSNNRRVLYDKAQYLNSCFWAVKFRSNNDREQGRFWIMHSTTSRGLTPLLLSHQVTTPFCVVFFTQITTPIASAVCKWGVFKMIAFRQVAHVSYWFTVPPSIKWQCL